MHPTLREQSSKEYQFHRETEIPEGESEKFWWDAGELWLSHIKQRNIYAVEEGRYIEGKHSLSRVTLSYVLGVVCIFPLMLGRLNFFGLGLFSALANAPYPSPFSSRVWFTCLDYVERVYYTFWMMIWQNWVEVVMISVVSGLQYLLCLGLGAVDIEQHLWFSTILDVIFLMEYLVARFRSLDRWLVWTSVLRRLRISWCLRPVVACYNLVICRRF